MTYLKIIPVIRDDAAGTPPSTGPPMLLRTDVICRVCPYGPAGAQFECVNLILEGGEAILCTGTVEDFIAAFNNPRENGRTVFDEPEPDVELYLE